MKKLFFAMMLVGAATLVSPNTAAAAGRGVAGSRSAPSVGRAVPRSGPVIENRGHEDRDGRWFGDGRFYRPGFGVRFGYDPFWYPWGYPAYAGPYVIPVGVTGDLRLQVEPKTAEVYVDGYYAGIVDQFNGHFHHLAMTPGGHRIEVRAPGFQPLTFSVYVQPDRTIDYKGTLSPGAAELSPTQGQ
jgi:hypothetical protein